MRGRALIFSAGDAKIEDDDLAIWGLHDIGGFDVVMKQNIGFTGGLDLVMHVGDAFANLDADL